MHLSVTFLAFLLPVLASASMDDQIVLTKPDSHDLKYTPQTTPHPTLADLLTIESSASIFYSYARELELSSLFSDKDSKITLFVPMNKAVVALPRKPHQGPELDVEIEMTEEQFHKRSKRNVERWVSAHIVPEYPLSLVSTHKTLLDGKAISFKPISKSDGHGPEWSRVSIEDGVKIVAKKEALNGDLYLIEGTISLD